MLKDNPKYKVVFTSKVHNIDFYQPVDVSQYHLSRKIAAAAQDIYSQSGATKETLESLMKRLLEGVNKEKNDINFRSDVAVIANNILYRLKYPVDQHCGVRMGAILTFMECENPEEMQDLFTQKKLEMALGNGGTIKADPELYAFFLNMGILFTPSYADLLDTLADKDYWEQRMKNLQGLTPTSP